MAASEASVGREATELRLNFHESFIEDIFNGYKTATTRLKAETDPKSEIPLLHSKGNYHLIER